MGASVSGVLTMLVFFWFFFRIALVFVSALVIKLHMFRVVCPKLIFPLTLLLFNT